MEPVYFVYNHLPDYRDKKCGYGSGHNPKEGKCRDSYNNAVYISNEFIPHFYERADINHCSFLSLFNKQGLKVDTTTVCKLKETNSKGIFPVGIRFDLLAKNFKKILSQILYPEIIDLINQDKLLLLIYDATSIVCGIRGHEHSLTRLKQFLLEKKVKLKNTVLITNYKSKDFRNSIKWNVLETCASLMLYEKNIKINYNKKIKNFNVNNCARFLLFNSRNRFHRFVLTYKLYENIQNFKKYCWYSLKQISFSDLIKLLHQTGNEEFLKSYNSISTLIPFKSFLKTLPAYVGLEYPYPKGDLSRFINKNVYEKSGIFIVTDGSITTPPNNCEPFLTEKTFKTIGFKMPFILYGEPGSLRYLKSLGYQTFESLWDESYDSIIDPTKRADAIVRLVASLCSLNNNKFVELLKKAGNIVEHNYMTLQTRQTEHRLIKQICNFVNN